MYRYQRKDFLWFSWERRGYVETYRAFEWPVYSRCGNVHTLFGYRWVNKNGY